MADNEEYWIERHHKLEGSLASVAKIGEPERENRKRYARKKRRLCDLLRAMELLDLSGKTVLDAGCGTGVISEVLYALGADVSGIDASSLAIDEARDRATSSPSERVRFIVGSLVDFQFLQTFDLTFCIDVLYHLVDAGNWRRTVANLLAHTRPGGHVIIVEQLKDRQESPDAHVVFRTKAMYDELADSLGARECTPPNHPGYLVYRRES